MGYGQPMGAYGAAPMAGYGYPQQPVYVQQQRRGGGGGMGAGGAAALGLG